jgi:NAD(P) transhydrogenase subunit beta
VHHSPLVDLAYLVAAVLFILTFKGLAHPRSAVRANALGATGMLIAVVATVLLLPGDRAWRAFWVIGGGLAVGGAIGATLAIRVQMTGMPQMVALLNGFGGIASVLVAGAAHLELLSGGDVPALQAGLATVASGLIGSVTFLGSLLAWAKLEERLPGRPIVWPGQLAGNAALLLVALGLGAGLVAAPEEMAFYWGIVALGAILGVTSVLPIGGADMPVVICVLNSYSGLAAAATGFVLDNYMLVIAGALVGSSGMILSGIMCRAMNRSLVNVLVGGFGGDATTAAPVDALYAKVKGASADEVAMVLESARRVVIVPGYGLAVAQAQHAVADLASLLESRGTTVEFGIHPVAGRMPGHMNVLLAEADIPYEKVREMVDVNPTFAETDVTIVIGANDVVNPLAREDPKSPIAGMPILDVDKARTVVVVKRSLSPGFAGIPNPLFAADNTLMYFADGKKAVVDLIEAIKQA